MKQILFQWILLLLLPAFGMAQVNVTGKITDFQTGEALAGATVQLEKTFKATAADRDGNFLLENINPGNYQLKISFVGYQTYRETIVLQENTHLEIQLQKSTVLTDEVIVSATRATEKTPTTYSNIDEEAIEKRNLGQDLPYLLNQTPSTVVTSDAGAGVGYTQIRIRGTDPTRINVTINGIPLNDSESQGVFWVNMPDFASSVENIQIQRGVGTSTNGAGAFGATVNIQTSMLNRERYAEINNSFGSYDTRKHTVKVGTGLIDNKITFDARLSKITSDGYIDRASSDLKSFYLSGGYYGKNNLLKLNIFSGKEETYQAWNGIPEDILNTGNRTYNEFTYDDQTDNYQQDHYQAIYAHDIGENWTLNGALHYTKGRGYFEEYKEEEALSDYGINNLIIGKDTIFSSDIIRRRWLDNDFYGLTYSVNYNTYEKLELTVGGALNRYVGDHFGEVIWAEYAVNSSIRERYYENVAEKNDFNIFTKAYYQLTPKLNAFGDLQFRRVHYTVNGFEDYPDLFQEDVFNFLNPKVGWTYSFDARTKLYTSFAVGKKEPNRNDYEVSPENKPTHETLRNLEVGFSKRGANYSFTANYYLMDYKNQLALTGEVNDVGAYTRTNVSNSYRTGVELQGSWNLLKNLQISANATLSRNKISNYKEFIDNYDEGKQLINRMESTDLAFSPNIIAGSEVLYQPFKNFEVSLISKYVGEQFLDNTSNDQRKIDDYFVNDIRMSYVFNPPFFNEIAFNLLVNNIFDIEYEANGYTYSYKAGGEVNTFNYYYPQAGVNFLAGVSLKF